MSRVIVIGGGASGMMAAISAARLGHEVTLIEKNEKLGKKIYITGKGRCNVFNACTSETFFDAISSNEKFLYSAYNSFTSEDVYEFFDALGLKMKVERGNRVFPISNHASDVTKVLEKELKENYVKILFNTEVKSLITDSLEANDDKNILPNVIIKGVILKDETIMEADSVIVATGGLSYPTTGSTGDGLKFAKEIGIETSKCIPSLVGLNCEDKACELLSGLSLKNVSIKIIKENKEIYSDFGEMLFTHFGVSGPIILTASSRVGRELYCSKAKLVIDLKPTLNYEKLDKKLLSQIETQGNKVFKNCLSKWVPKSLEDEIIIRTNIDPFKPIKFFTKKDRKKFLDIIKHFELKIIGLREFKEAIITKGGVSTKEIKPKTMESKKVKNLYFVGEVLDLDALTGGFNLQIAWSTGYVAGKSIEW